MIAINESNRVRATCVEEAYYEIIHRPKYVSGRVFLVYADGAYAR